MLDVKFLLPSFTEAEAVRLAEEWYGLHGTARTLPSERDRNFLLTAESGEQFVLKISNAADSEPVLDMQNRALEHLAVTVRPGDMVITLGAGNVWQVGEQLANHFRQGGTA